MFLLEHDAKELLAARGIAVPAGILVRHPDEVADAALPPGPWVVKAQVPVGGRGKAGAILRAADGDELVAHVAGLTSRRVHGHPVRACRIEQQVHGADEAYLGFLVDGAAGGVQVLVSAGGGMDVEQEQGLLRSRTVPAQPDALAAAVDELAAGFPEAWQRALREAGGLAARAFADLDALLVEINPLFIWPDGRWVAGDAKLIVDDNGIARQPAVQGLLEQHSWAYPETVIKWTEGFDYVDLHPDGEIGLVSTGAGLGMMVVDELEAQGLRARNFVDIRTGLLRGDPRRLIRVLEWISGPNLRVVLVNVFAGVTYLGEFARLLLEALDQVPQLRVPVVARLVGTGLEDARQVLATSDRPIVLTSDLDEAVARAAALAKGVETPC